MVSNVFYPLTSAYLEFSPGVELLQTFDRLLPVHAGCHSGTMLGRGSHAAVRAFKMCNLNIFISRKETHRDPWVLEGLGCCDPFGWIDGQHLVNEIFGFRSHRVPLGRGKLGRGEEVDSCPHPNQRVINDYVIGISHVSFIKRCI